MMAAAAAAAAAGPSSTRLVRPPRLLGFGGRPFNFFDREALGGANGLSGVLPGKFSAALLVEGPALVLADADGNVAFTDGELRVALQHKMLERPVKYGRVLLARSRQSPPLLVLCGVESAMRAPLATAAVVVKTWVGSKLTAPSNVIDVSALLMQLLLLQQQQQQQQQQQGGSGGMTAAAAAGGGPSSLEPTALACNHDGTKIVVGFRSGMVLLMEGDFARDNAKLAKPPAILRPALNDHPVSALHFLYPPEGSTAASATTAAASTAHKLYVLLDTSVPSSPPQTPPSSMPPPPSPGSSSGAVRGGVLVYDTTAAGERARPVVLDEDGAAPGCSGVDSQSLDLVVGRPDALFFYSEEEGRKGALGFEARQGVCLLGPAGGSGSSSSGSGAASVLVATTEPGGGGRTVLHVYDLRNKLVAFTAALAPGQGKVAGMVAGVAEEGGAPGGGVAYVVTAQGAVLRLREKPALAKVKLLAEDMRQFPAAIKLAYASSVDPGRIMEIYRRYGDHLYEKKRAYDEAVQQYIHTIGHLDPSYVIARFLDAPRLKQLTAYLEALHRKGQATAELTTFLLNCYAKLKDTEKLDMLVFPERFLDGEADVAVDPPTESEGEGEEGQDGEGGGEGAKRRVVFLPAGLALLPPTEEEEAAAALQAAGGGDGSASSNTAGSRGLLGGRRRGHVDVEAAVGVLRGAGYMDHALELARKFRAHEAYLRIQLERPHPSYRDALTYISSLPFEAAAAYVRRYGRRLLAALPEETTGVAVALCTGKFTQRERGGGGAQQQQPQGQGGKEEDAGNGPRAAAEEMVPLFVDHPTWLRAFLECVLKAPGLALATSVGDSLLELLVQDWASSASAQGGGGKDRRQLRRQREAELLAFLEQQEGRYDPQQALVLVTMHGFRPGQLLLHEQGRRVELVLEHYMAKGDTQAVLARMARKENRKNADLWLKVLAYVVEEGAARERRLSGVAGPSSPVRKGRRRGESSGSEGEGIGREGGESSEEEEEYSDDDEDGEGGMQGAAGVGTAWGDVARVLQTLEKERVLPAQIIIETLGRNGAVPLGVARPFLARLLREAYGEVQGSQARIEALRESTAAKRREVGALRSTARLFQATTCNSCRRPLEPPAVHFLCMHSYHLDASCLAREGECNECGPAHRHYGRIRQAQPSHSRTPSVVSLGGEGGVGAVLPSSSLVEHEHFFSELEEHGFAAVAAYFGKGVLNVGVGGADGLADEGLTAGEEEGEEGEESPGGWGGPGRGRGGW